MHIDLSISLISANLEYFCVSNADYCPRGIQDLLEIQGVEVTTEQVMSHLEV